MNPNNKQDGRAYLQQWSLEPKGGRWLVPAGYDSQAWSQGPAAASTQPCAQRRQALPIPASQTVTEKLLLQLSPIHEMGFTLRTNLCRWQGPRGRWVGKLSGVRPERPVGKHLRIDPLWVLEGKFTVTKDLKRILGEKTRSPSPLNSGSFQMGNWNETFFEMFRNLLNLISFHFIWLCTEKST